MRTIGGVLAFLAVSLPSVLVAATPCTELSNMRLSAGHIDSAKVIDKGAFPPPQNSPSTTTYETLPAFCRVTATLVPTPDSDITIEVWLPTSGWNGKYQGVGNGGWAGTVSYAALARAVADGYAAASTDTGHVGPTAAFAVVLSLTDPNLRPFFQRGGKLLMYHGWQDPQVPAQNTTRYFNEIVKTLGREVVGTSVQLFMVPGMNHCSGGPGTDTFDMVRAIEQWRQSGQAPTHIVAAHRTNGAVDRTRPLCPYGQTARWNGTGSSDDAANFSCVASR